MRIILVSIASFCLVQTVLCQHLYINAGTGLSSLHAQKITTPFNPKLDYSLGLSLERNKPVSSCGGILFEKKGAKNPHGNWDITLHYLTASVGVKFAYQRMHSLALGGYASILIHKNMRSENTVQSSDVYTSWKKQDAGLWLEASTRTNLALRVNNMANIGLFVFVRGQYGLVDLLEKWSGLLSSQGEWIRNVSLNAGVKLKLP